jgi:hypothetical protein
MRKASNKKALRESSIQNSATLSQMKNGTDANYRLAPTKKAPMQNIMQFRQ